METKKASYHIIAENQILLTCESLAEAVALLIASYFIFNCKYPKSSVKTMTFIENFVFDIQTEKKLPSHVINFAQKLKNCVQK